MTCTEEYKEHIEYTFHAFCKIVIRNASYTALRTWSRKHKREISLDYITDEKHYPLGTTDEYFKAPEPDEEYIVHLCGDTVILSNGLLVQALSRLPAQKQEMLYLSFFKRMPQHEIGRRYGRSRSAAGYHMKMVDDGKLKTTPAVELSYLTPEEQEDFLSYMESEGCTPSLSQAQKLKEASKESVLTPEKIQHIMAAKPPSVKPRDPQLMIPVAKVERYFPKGFTSDQMQQVIVKLLENYARAHQHGSR